jgi:hypothetical protein
MQTLDYAKAGVELRRSASERVEGVKQQWVLKKSVSGSAR